MLKIVYETNSHTLILQSLVICRFIGTQEFIYCGYNLITSLKDSKTFNLTERGICLQSGVLNQTQLLTLTHLRQWRFVEVQLQPHDHIWEISSMETHNIFGDPGRSKTAVGQKAKSGLVMRVKI